MRKPTSSDKLYDGIYSQDGAPVCDGKTAVEYLNTDPRTGYHLFRCPPAGCSLKQRSNGMVRYYDTTVHSEDPANNLRVLGVVSRASPKWRTLYKRRPVREDVRESEAVKASGQAPVPESTQDRDAHGTVSPDVPSNHAHMGPVRCSR